MIVWIIVVTFMVPNGNITWINLPDGAAVFRTEIACNSSDLKRHVEKHYQSWPDLIEVKCNPIPADTE